MGRPAGSINKSIVLSENENTPVNDPLEKFDNLGLIVVSHDGESVTVKNDQGYTASLRADINEDDIVKALQSVGLKV